MTDAVLQPGVATAESPRADAARRLREFRHACHARLRQATSSDMLAESLAQELQQRYGVVGCCLVTGLDRGEGNVVPMGESASPSDARANSLLSSVARAAVHAQAPQVGRAGSPPAYAAAAPMQWEGEPSAALAALALQVDVRELPQLAEAVEAAAEILAWQRGRPADAQWKQTAQTCAAMVELVARVQRRPSQAAAMQTLADELADFLQVERVLVALPHGSHKSLEIAAVSGETPLSDEQRDFARGACDESLLRGGVSVWPPPGDGARHALLAHRQAAEIFDAPCVATVPLGECRQPRGALLVVSCEPCDDVRRATLASLAEPLDAALTLWQRAEGNRLGRAWDSAVAWCASRRGKLALAAAAVIAAVMCIPFPYAVKCDCEVRPAVRRYVAAPFDAVLQRALVEPGDIVAAGQPLGQLDGREIEWELAGVSAELNRAATERSGHLAAGDPGAARIAGFEMERLQLSTRLLDHRSQTLDVRSPIEGIVIAGDLQKSEGVPVQRGETLFEIAPLDRMRIELEIPQDDVPFLIVGQPVEFTLEAYPGRVWTGAVSRIRPQTEERDDRWVFIAELEAANSAALLRPGMEGRASIRTEAHPLGWNLFHRSWNRCLLWLGW